MNELLRATRSAHLSYYADMTHILYKTSEADPGFLPVLCVKLQNCRKCKSQKSEWLIPYLKLLNLFRRVCFTLSRLMRRR